MGAGGGAIAGGGLCVGLTVGACLPAGAASVAAGGALVLEGAGMSVRGAIGLGSDLVLLAKKAGMGKSPNQLNEDIKKGNAPEGIDRVDTPKIPNEQLHVHLDDGSALNVDGSWKHGESKLTSAIKKWLTKNGWILPK